MRKFYGVMNDTVKLLGSSLVLHAGEIVELTAPTNLPKTDKVQWFAKPRYPRQDWLGGEDDSILIDDRNVYY
mgnify:CR=1 FL=1